MIGIKPIEDFTFDECLDFIDSHSDGDPEWGIVNHRHQLLLAQLQADDNASFVACKSKADYRNYLQRFAEPISGAARYQPLHQEETLQIIETHATPIKDWFASFTTNAGLRREIQLMTN